MFDKPKDQLVTDQERAASKRGCFPIDPGQAEQLNALGFGIFWTVQEFNGPRKIQNLERITAWAIDLDQGTKAEQMARITAHLFPSMIVESKAGYHVYWNAKDATAENYQAILLDRLVPIFGADPRARDLARILRVPGFNHLKNPTDPFPVRTVYEHTVSYSEDQMLSTFPLPPEAIEASRGRQELRQAFGQGDDLWERVWNMDCLQALERLSGHPSVGSETFSFKPNRSGTWNILVNGKGTSCWVDLNGRIGSPNKGGPTIFQWIRWYGHSNAQVVAVLRAVFPELWQSARPAGFDPFDVPLGEAP